MSSPKTVRWGILATGGIAVTFTKDLLVDPQTRGVTHVKHTVVAAASSSSQSRAKDFLTEVGAPADAEAYGSYDELVKDPNVDIIYVATPHSHHYQNAMLCLEAGKPVLVEKALTTNAAQAKALIAKAKEKNLFFMEAVWTRYFPLSIYVRDLITSGRVGIVERVIADNSMSTDPEENFPDGKHRMVNPDLAGGALLDAGIYSLTWLFQTLYLTQPPEARKPPTVASALKLYPKTKQADEMATILLTFPRPTELGGDAHAVATTSLRISPAPGGVDSPTVAPCCRVQGDKGEVQIFPPAYRPVKSRLVLRDGTVEEKEWRQPGPGKGSGWFNGFGGTYNAEGEGQGMFWEADEAATALVEGRKQSKFEGWEESVVIMEVMDEVRRQGGLVYPEKIETTDYPVKLG